MGRIQLYLGVDPVQVEEQYRKAARDAQITCTRCGAFVAHENQQLHQRWHYELAREASRPAQPLQ